MDLTHLLSSCYDILSSRPRPITSTVTSVEFSRFLPTTVPSLFVMNDDKETWMVVQPQPRSSLDPDSTLEVHSSSSSAEVTSSDETEIRRVLRVGRLLIKSEKYKEALRLTEQILRKHPTHAELLVLEGECLKHSGNLTKVCIGRGFLCESAMMSQAITCFAKAEAYDARNAETVMHLAAIHHQQGDLPSCLELVQRACDLKPENRVQCHGHLCEISLCEKCAAIQEDTGRSAH